MLEQLKIETAKMLNDLKKLLSRDSLTGLYNREYFIEKVNGIILEARPDKDRFGILFIDFNNFKVINDTLGHHAGDKVILEAARRLSSAVSENWLLARYGGDEFVMLVCDITARAAL